MAIRATLSLAAILVLLLTLAPAQAGAKDGKTLFTEYKCVKCHSIEAVGITKAKDKNAAEESGGLDDEFEEEKAEPPDLSDVGSKRDKAWLSGWLQKDITNDDGKKHKMRFKGDEEELATLVDYLFSLKGEAK